jgi:predicted NAD/FAD-binding protein
VLHTDRRLLPRRRAAWASWNYHVARDAGRPVAVTYDLTRLQRVDAAEPICLTLNGPRTIDAARVVRRIRFRHPLFDRRALGGQARWEEINGRQRTWYCGAYWGHGFHEDGVNSALAVGRRFDLNLDTLDTLDTCDLDSCRAVSTRGSSGIAV